MFGCSVSVTRSYSLLPYLLWYSYFSAVGVTVIVVNVADASGAKTVYACCSLWLVLHKQLPQLPFVCCFTYSYCTYLLFLLLCLLLCVFCLFLHLRLSTGIVSMLFVSTS